MGRKASRRREKRTADLTPPESVWAESKASQTLGVQEKLLFKQLFLVKPNILTMTLALSSKQLIDRNTSWTELVG